MNSKLNITIAVFDYQKKIRNLQFQGSEETKKFLFPMGSEDHNAHLVSLICYGCQAETDFFILCL